MQRSGLLSIRNPCIFVILLHRDFLRKATSTPWIPSRFFRPLRSLIIPFPAGRGCDARLYIGFDCFYILLYGSSPPIKMELKWVKTRWFHNLFTTQEQKKSTYVSVSAWFRGVEIVGIVSTLHSALQASTNHYSTLKKCRYRYWILPKFVTFL